jgi:hypothetical protein
MERWRSDDMEFRKQEMKSDVKELACMHIQLRRFILLRSYSTFTIGKKHIIQIMRRD